MALFMIERNFASALNASPQDLRAVVDINTVVGVKWLYSFLSADKRKTYCLYEAESGDAIREAARRAGLPADVVIELAGELPTGGAAHRLMTCGPAYFAASASDALNAFTCSNSGRADCEPLSVDLSNAA